MSGELRPASVPAFCTAFRNSPKLRKPLVSRRTFPSGWMHCEAATLLLNGLRRARKSVPTAYRRWLSVSPRRGERSRGAMVFSNNSRAAIGRPAA